MEHEFVLNMHVGEQVVEEEDVVVVAVVTVGNVTTAESLDIRVESVEAIDTVVVAVVVMEVVAAAVVVTEEEEGDLGQDLDQMNATEDEDPDPDPEANHDLEVDPEIDPDVIQAEIVVTDLMKEDQSPKKSKLVVQLLMTDQRVRPEQKDLHQNQDLDRKHLKRMEEAPVVVEITVTDTVIHTVTTRQPL